MENGKNMNKIELPAAEQLLTKIQKLEESHAHLKEEIANLIISGEHKQSDRQKSNSTSPGRPRRRTVDEVLDGGHRAACATHTNKTNNESFRKSGGVDEPSKLTETQYVNILQSMGQSLHMFDLNGRIIYWNQMAQNLYGYTVPEALGKTAPDIIIGPKYSDLATLIIMRAAKGESWSGEFPVRNKRWERFSVITTLSPCRDENGTILGVMCVSTDARPFRDISPQVNVSAPCNISSAKFGLDSQQPLQTAIASKISNLAAKVKSKIKTGGDNNTDDEHFSEFASCDHKNGASSTGERFGGGSENKPGIHKVISSKAEAWMGKKGISWPWKGNDREGDGSSRFNWPWVHNDEEHECGQQTSSMKVESQPFESANASNTNSWTSSSGSTNSNSINKIEIDIDNMDVEISWDDLTIGEQIGQGSCGTVYHALWYGSDVAVKVFTKQEYPDDVILSFRKEVSLMKRLRHPNILLFMGAVTSPHHLCIVTEFLPRGSLFRLLQRNTNKLDWRRRVHMAMDIARGMNYLHHCNPPIIHRDLKSSNLLVDKNWTVKVGDFGLSRIKHETYLTTKTGNGTPQWMAPDILRNEKADEKSDVYSYGVVLWEIITEKIPWENLNSMQVIGAVGFMNQRLEIPKDVDPQWASLIESCWSSEPQFRPTFQEILIKLKDLQKKFAVQFQVPRRDNSGQKGS